jgi:hypothetical protein
MQIRWGRPRSLAERVRHIRQQYSRWGKDKLAVLLRCETLRVSAMVGRILADLQRRAVLIEPPRAAVLRRIRRGLRHRPWATRKPRFWPVRQPGDLVELDTKEVRPRSPLLLTLIGCCRCDSGVIPSGGRSPRVSWTFTLPATPAPSSGPPTCAVSSYACLRSQSRQEPRYNPGPREHAITGGNFV